MRARVVALGLALAGCGSAPEAIEAPARGAGPVASASAKPPRDAPSLPAVACSRAKPSNPTFLAAVVLRGTRQTSACAKLGTFAGAPLDAAMVEADLRTLYATRLFEDVVAVIEEDAGTQTVVFEVKERPRLEGVDVIGAPANVDADDAVGKGPERFDPVWVRGAEKRLVDALHFAGFRHGSVAHEVKKGDDAVRVRLTITAGQRLGLGAARFEGLVKAREQLLTKDLAMKPGEPVPEEMVERDGLAVNAALYDLGMVESSVSTRVEENPNTATVDVVFTVTEGPIYALGKVKITGKGALAASRYTKLLATLPQGSIFVRTKVAQVVQGIESMHRDAGDPRHVEVVSRLDPKKHAIDLDFVVE